jgi:ATP-dependent Clp protease ATP-binding subunit ClpA
MKNGQRQSRKDAIKISLRTLRPLKCAIQEHLLDPITTKLLAGEFRPNDKIKVSANGDNLAFKVK